MSIKKYGKIEAKGGKMIIDDNYIDKLTNKLKFLNFKNKRLNYEINQNHELANIRRPKYN